MKKTQKRHALLMSALSLLLCVSMLVGTTFAWFTDSVTSGVNTIAAGNLDVELYHGKTQNPTDKVNTGTLLFTDVDGNEIKLWEPGVVAFTNLKVANVGTLALKYQLSVNSTKLNTVKGTDLTLEDALKVAVVKNGVDGDRAAVIAAGDAAGWTGLKTFNLPGVLDANETSEAYGIVIYWQPGDEDNRFNMNNGKETSDGQPLSITLGVNLFATQQTKEKDSFDHLYDDIAAVFTVKEANDLMAENKDANLVGANEPSEILYIPANYTGTLVLNNVKVASVQESDPIATVADEQQTVVVPTEHKIVILGNVIVKATQEGMSAITGTKLNITGDGKLTAIGMGEAAFGIGGLTTESVTVSNVTIKEVVGGCAGEVGTDPKYYKDAPGGGAAIGSGKDGAVITLNKVDILKAVGGSKAAAIGARFWTGVTVNITDSVIDYAEGGATAAAIGGSRVSSEAAESGTTINIANSTITAKGGAYGAGIGSGYDTHCSSKQPLCTINIDGSTINATGGQYAAGVGTGYHNAALAGEIKNSTVNAVSGEKIYKASYTAAMDIGFGVTDPTREGLQTDSKLIYNGKEITCGNADKIADTDDALASKLQNDTAVVLTAGEFKLPSLAGKKNVTIVGAEDGSTKLNGVNSFSFGENTTLKNVTFKTSGGHSVRYGTTTGDVVFENCVFEGKQYGMHIDNANDGTVTFNNCTFYGRNAFAKTGTYVFNNCTFKYTYSNYNTINIYSTATFNDCKWDSKLELYLDPGAKAIVDGEEITQKVVFISDARALESFQQSVNWKSTSYAGVTVMLSADIDMKDAYYANWIPIGQTGATQFQGTFDGHGYTIKNLNVDASKQTGANYSSGLFGWLNHATVKNLTIENATITGNHNVGVIAGYMETAGCTISNCHVVGATVVAKHANDDACGDKVGVIVGHAGNAGVKVENCSVKDSTVTAGRDAGQIAGAALTANVVGCSATNVTVTAGGDCTGANVNEALIGRVLG